MKQWPYSKRATSKATWGCTKPSVDGLLKISNPLNLSITDMGMDANILRGREQYTQERKRKCAPPLYYPFLSVSTLLRCLMSCLRQGRQSEERCELHHETELAHHCTITVVKPYRCMMCCDNSSAKEKLRIGTSEWVFQKIMRRVLWVWQILTLKKVVCGYDWGGKNTDSVRYCDFRCLIKRIGKWMKKQLH